MAASKIQHRRQPDVSPVTESSGDCAPAIFAASSEVTWHEISKMAAARAAPARDADTRTPREPWW